MPEIANATATIPSGTALSNAVPCFDASHVAVIFPSAWTTAGLTMQVAWTDATPQTADWRSLYVDNAEVVLAAAADRVAVLGFNATIPSARWIRFRSGTQATPVNQGAERVLRLLWWKKI